MLKISNKAQLLFLLKWLFENQLAISCTLSTVAQFI